MIKPSSKEISKYLKKWDTLENYVHQESSLYKLFNVTYPENRLLDEVLIKVCSLNTFYSNNIYSPFAVAKHIVSLGIDKLLNRNDLDLVNKIALIRIRNRKWNFYSFASKYCSHHKPTVYPIYDSYVEKVLMLLKSRDKFFEFRRADLKQYSIYRGILIQFQKHYGLKKYNLKQIDKYLWQVGKEHFSLW